MKRTIVLFTLFFVTEIAIAVFKFHSFIRGFVGDVLVIPLLFYFLKIFTRWRTIYLASSVLGIAILVEFIQLTSIVENLTSKSKLLSILLGTTFDPLDIIAYGIGFMLVLAIENLNKS